MKTILVATDFSEYAHYAVMSAASICKQTGAQLILLHVVNRPLIEDDDSYENYYNHPGGKTIVSNVKNELDSIVNTYSLQKVKVIYELRYDVFKTILRHADEQNVDLIIMGAYGKSGSDESYIGSNTERVMRNAKMPVLIVKEKFEEFKVKNMVLASEFYGGIYDVFPLMKKVIDLFDANIRLLKVNTPNHFQTTRDSNDLMIGFKTEFNLQSSTMDIYNDMNVEDGIMNFTSFIEADLIAISPDGHWRVANIFKKNITDKLMKRSVKMILSMKTV